MAVSDPVLVARKRCEDRYIREVLEGLSQRAALIPWLAESPIGAKKLLATLTFKQHGETVQMAKAS